MNLGNCITQLIKDNKYPISLSEIFGQSFKLIVKGGNGKYIIIHRSILWLAWLLAYLASPY
jgi:hypothetical protein